MKLIIPESIEKQMEKTKISVNDFVNFLRKTPFGSNRLIELCAPLEDTKAYKAYLNNLKRVVIFCVNKKD